MSDPAIRARVAELESAGVASGDAIGQAVAERDQRANPPQWLRAMLVEPTTDNPEENR